MHFDSTEWLHSDARRTAIGLDLDVETLDWCMENNVNKVGADVSSRMFLFHGNVLQPLEAKLVNASTQNLMQNVTLRNSEDDSPDHKLMKDFQFPARDIVCAFNYSCCCLHTRQELVSYFKHALSALNKKGGIFVMDLYGGTSAEHELRMQRKFPNFTVCLSKLQQSLSFFIGLLVLESGFSLSCHILYCSISAYEFFIVTSFSGQFRTVL